MQDAHHSAGSLWQAQAAGDAPIAKEPIENSQRV